MKRFIRIYLAFIIQHLKKMMSYRFDFITGLTGFLFLQISGILFIAVIFNHTPHINGWSLYEIVFIYGFSLLPRGLDHLLTDNLWFMSSKYIIQGELDRYLIRPINPLFQLISEVFQPDAIGELITGIILINVSLHKLQLHLSYVHIFLMLLCIVSGTMIFASIKLVFASLAFWIKDSRPIMFLIYSLSDFAKYPVTIYSPILQFLLSYILPFAFTAYFPAGYFLNKINVYKAVGGTLSLSILISLAAYQVWLQGLKKYESSGT